MEYKFKLSISDNSYPCKGNIVWAKVTYTSNTINLNTFEYLIKCGYNFCYIFNNEKHLTQREKTINNWCYTSVVFVDIDDIDIDMDTFINTLTYKPTIAYTTFSNGFNNKFSYRLVYCFNQIINDVNFYKNIYFNIVYKLESDNSFEMKDNCAQSVAQQFAGNACDSCIVYRNDNDVYDVECFNLSLNNQKCNFNYKKEEENSIASKLHFQDEQYIKDYWSLPYKELLDKYIEKYHWFDSTDLDFSNEDVPYVLLPKNYIEIKRYWLYEKDENNTYKSAKVRKLRDGEHRRKHLFINGVLRRLMHNDITFEYILHMLVNELYYFISNIGDEITKKDLFTIAKNVMKADLTKYNALIKKDDRTFIVNPRYCAKYNVTKRQATSIARKELNYQKIGEMYDYSLTDKENLKVFEENDLHISLRTLKNFRKDNGLTKYKKDKS